MFCNKCGNEVYPNQKFCNKCGNHLLYTTQNNAIPNNTIENNMMQNDAIQNHYRSSYLNYNNKNSNTKIIIITVVIMIIIILLTTVILLITNKNSYNFDYGNVENSVNGTPAVQNGDNNNTIQNGGGNTIKSGKNATAIITDNVYYGISINNEADAIKLIEEDSIKQKQADYPQEIIEIENRIIQNYSITAVNLKELDVEFAKELENVIKNIYTNFPSARGHLTNLTLTNLDMSNNGVIALFMPVFTFGTSNTTTTRPWVIKTQIQLNARYFLDPTRIDSSVQASSKVGHFPKNATRNSPVAHELGHYLSFIAMMNHYSTNSVMLIDDNKLSNYYEIIKDFGKGDFSKQMLDEAYQNYVRDNGTIDFDQWRGQISQYALAKDEQGEYIYDETIAEAFHDVYLNGDNANSTSKYIIQVLKKYIEG